MVETDSMICGKATGMVTNCMDLKSEISSENDYLKRNC